MMSSRLSSESVEGRGGQFLLRDARYGLRGVRVGEANNPGPRRQCRHCFASSSEHNYEVKDLNSSRSERTPQEREGEDQEPRWTRRIWIVC